MYSESNMRTGDPDSDDTLTLSKHQECRLNRVQLLLKYFSLGHQLAMLVLLEIDGIKCNVFQLILCFMKLILLLTFKTLHHANEKSNHQVILCCANSIQFSSIFFI